MDQATLLHGLNHPSALEASLRSWELSEPAAAAEELRQLADQVPLDLVASLAGQLGERLPKCGSPDQAFAGLMKFLAVARSPLAMLSLIDRDRACLPILVQIFATSDAWTELLLRDPEAFDFLRITEGMPSSREELQAEVDRETAHIVDERTIMSALRRVREREQLRIGYGELFRHVRIEIAMRQLSDLAEAIVAAALRFAASVSANAPLPRLTVIGLGRVGGGEQDYLSGLELLFVCDNVGPQDFRRGSAVETLEKITKQTVRILNEKLDGEPAVYPVSFPVKPGEEREALVTPLDDWLYYCDAKGRTWERSILLTARPIAGDLELGREFLEQLQPWLYRRYLHRADETGLHALKRRIQRDSSAAERTDLVQGRGGIHEIEEAVRFLQLLSGGEHEIVRSPGTIAGIAGLEQAEVITVEERSALEQGYERLRQWEHRGELAGRLKEPSEELLSRQQRQAETVERLFASAFKDEGVFDPVSELILEPAPTPEQISSALSPYGFQDVPTAAAELRTLAVERIPFLSTRRSRHFLAEIAPALLRSIAATPAPDYTLAKLARVSDSLGGKGVLWELFQKHPASLQLYVRLCGASLYLSELLTSHPGMIDDLLDSLLLSHLPTVEELEAVVKDLLMGHVSAMQPALASFRQSQHLRIGVREMLRLEDVASTHKALAAVAEVCVRQIAQDEYDRLAQKYGEPGTPNGDRCRLVILALGKVGGREPNYHSPLELAFVYETDGATQPPIRARSATSTTNAHFFSLLAQRILKTLTELGPQGRLYEVHTPLRPQGKTGPVAISRDELQRYLREGPLEPAERLTLVKARPIYGVPTACAAVENLIVEALIARPWQAEYGASAARAAGRRAAGDGAQLKRAPGGTTDVETVIQILQWQHADAPGFVGIGTLTAIDRLRERGWLSAADADHWSGSYRYLRGVESSLRLMNVPARHDLPSTSVDWQRLAMVLQYAEPQQLAEHVRATMAENRERFERFFG